MHDLRFQEIIGDFGMFFLHDLIIDPPSLPNIEESDNEEVHALMKLPKNKSKASRVMELHGDGGSVASPDFPLGERPPWALVVEMLSTHPERFLRQWTFPALVVSLDVIWMKVDSIVLTLRT